MICDASIYVHTLQFHWLRIIVWQFVYIVTTSSFEI